MGAQRDSSVKGRSSMGVTQEGMHGGREGKILGGDRTTGPPNLA